MTKIEGYKCDHCKTVYGTSDEAVYCEGNHVMVEGVQSIYKKSDSFPQRIIVTFDDGKRAYYEYECHTNL